MEILYSCYILYGPHRGRLVFQHFIPYVRYNDDACRYWCVQIESNLLRCRIVIPTACSSLAGYAAATAEADVSPEGKQRLPGKVGVCWLDGRLADALLHVLQEGGVNTSKYWNIVGRLGVNLWIILWGSRKMQKVAPQGLPKLTNWAWLRYGPERFFYDQRSNLGARVYQGVVA